MATYAIGDIQGCYDALMRVLDKASFDDNDTLWVAGDLVNRGKQSLATLRFLQTLDQRAKIVLGNHDLHLLAVAYGVRKAGRSDTLDEILQAPDRDQLLDWLRHQPLLHYDTDLGYLMVHAGIPPQWSLKQAQSLANEVESALRSTQITSFLQQMYGDQPERWDNELESWLRLRVITNYLTRMRLCDAKGTLNLTHKTGITESPAGFKPWFAHQHRKTRDQRILFGHWAALEGESNEDRVYALDTGCVWGGRLTMMRLEDQRIFSCNCESI